jgi:hypothetical protein
LWATGGVAAAVLTALTVLGLAGGQQIRRDPFEGRDPVWLKGPTDAAFRETAHQMTEETAHRGQRCEMLQLEAEHGTFIHYFYETGRAPLSEELAAGVWVKADRPGVQLLARLVLPHERNPANLDEPLTALLGGDQYQAVSRWQRLELRRPQKLARDQQALLRAELKRPVNIDDAYIDRLVLNVYTGPGRAEIFIDDLEIGPVTNPAPAPAAAATSGGEPGPGAPGVLTGRPVPGRTMQRRPAVIELDRDQLRVGGKSFFFRAIRHTDTPLDVLRAAGFNTIWLDDQTPPEVVQQAVEQGFWLVPALPVNEVPDGTTGNTYLTANTNFGRRLSRFLDLDADAVLFWDLGGGGLAAEQSTAVARTASLVHSADPQRPLAADVWDGFDKYGHSVNLLGVHRWPLMTSLELPQYRDWLNQRRLLANPGTFMWTWVQTHLPDWHTTLVYDRPGSAEFDEPIGPLPEQIRLVTYVALSSGCRGLGFWSDRFLANSHQGRDRLLALALINQELKMFEPLLLASETPSWEKTSSPDVSAAVFRTEKAVLVLPVWVGRGAQFVPGQGGVASLEITVPQVPDGTDAWEVSPGEVTPLKVDRVRGGSKVKLREFGLTSAVVFTADNTQTGLLVHLQDQARKMRKVAAQWAHDLAEVELDKTARVYTELEKQGHALPDGQRRLDDCRQRLQRCAQEYNDGDYGEAYLEAKRAARPLGLLMRESWEKAAGELDAPVASPYAVSYFTLPRHWAFADQVRRSSASANVLPKGDFEEAPDRAPEAWVAQAVTLDEVDLAARRVTQDPHGGKQCLQLEVKPKTKDVPPAALERTFLAIHSPAVRLQPGTLVRVTGWARVPDPIQASADGALLYDSAGGEPLAIRLQGPIKEWRQFTWYRRVPASGTLNVTLALTGLGSAYFDDIRIEPLHPGGGPLVAAVDGSLRSPKPKKKKDLDLHQTTSRFEASH